MSEAALPYTKPNIDWTEIERWDRAYYLHNTAAQEEYVFAGIEGADGNYLYTAGGDKLLDFQSQLVSDNMGHRHPRVHAELKRAMERFGHVFFGFGTDYRARAAKLVIDDVLGAEDWAGRVRILSSGTEAVENAMTMARLYTNKPIVLTQERSYHGLVPGATQVAGYRGNLSTGPDTGDNRDVPGFPGSGILAVPTPEYSDWQGTGRLPSLDKTEEIIRSVGAGKIAAIITETMFGGASFMPHHSYLKGLHDICRKHGILWILDDVLCGFGRLGEWFSYQIEPGISPDIMALGKGINGCALPVGAVVASKDVAEFFDRARWWSGSTHDGHPLVCASIVGNLEAMIEDDMINKGRTRGAQLKERLDDLKTKHPSIGRISGRGIYFTIDLVTPNGDPIIAEDRDTLFEGDLSKNPNNIFAAACGARGLFAGGFMPNTVKAAPPLTITEEEVDFAVGVMDEAFSAVEKIHH
jgi:taurine--2-oxoglutarate transaminase